MLKRFWNDETGVIIAAELILILTIAVLAIVVGLSEVAVAVNTELNDTSNALGALNQSFNYTGFSGTNGSGGFFHKVKSFSAGSSFADSFDDCDLNTTCDIVVGGHFNQVE